MLYKRLSGVGGRRPALETLDFCVSCVGQRPWLSIQFLAQFENCARSSTRPRPSIPPRPSPSQSSCSTSRCPTRSTTDGPPPAVRLDELSHSATLSRPAQHPQVPRPFPGAALASIRDGHGDLARDSLRFPCHTTTHRTDRLDRAVGLPIRLSWRPFMKATTLASHASSSSGPSDSGQYPSGKSRETWFGFQLYSTRSS